MHYEKLVVDRECYQIMPPFETQNSNEWRAYKRFLVQVCPCEKSIDQLLSSVRPVHLYLAVILSCCSKLDQITSQYNQKLETYATV